MAELPLLRYGRCTVCDRRTLFVLRNRSSNAMRGEARCVRCDSRSRNRHVAQHACRVLGVASLGELREATDRRVLNTSSDSPIGRRLAGLDHVTNTAFRPDVTPGTMHGGVRCEDLTALTYPDHTFDLVITEDVLEHIPDARQAFEEIHRVLKPGGAHVFSIPFRADRPSRARFTMVDGEPVLDEPVLFHTDPGQGEIAVYHDHGYTLLDDLASIGFDTRIARSQYRDQRAAAIYDSTTFVSRVPRRRVDAEETAT